MAGRETLPVHVIESVSSSMLEVIRIGTLPFIVVSFYFVIAVLGTLLNVTLMVMFKRWNHYKIPGTSFLIQMTVSDLLACIVCLPLSITAAITREWPLPDVVCSMYGVASRWLYHLSFMFLSFCAIERAVLFKNDEIHSKTFGKGWFVALVCVCIYTVTFVLASLPLIPSDETGTITYIPAIFQCGVIQGSSQLILNMDFVVTIVSSVVVYFVCSILIFQARRGLVVRRINRETNFEMQHRSGSRRSETPGAEEDSSLASGSSMRKPLSRSSSPSVTVSIQDSPRRFKRPLTSSVRGLQKLRCTGQMVVEVLKDNIDDAAYHMAVTYLLTWSIVAIFWSVQPILTYIEVYGPMPTWGGAHIIAIMIGSLSYCTKPIVYLSHNRNFQKQTKSVLPKAVKHTATKVKVKLSSTVDMIDRVVFDPRPGCMCPKSGRVGSADSIRGLEPGGVSRSSTELSDDVWEKRTRRHLPNSHRVTSLKNES